MDYFEKYKVIGICGAAWGDEGKGKFTDFFARGADAVIRAQGGNNAGHTVIAQGRKLKLHVVPSGIIYSDKLNIIGNGVVLDPIALFHDELEVLRRTGISADNLKISGDAHIIMPYHRLFDLIRSYQRIGTTACGIGPCYSDKINRTGIRVSEILDFKKFRQRVKGEVEDYNRIFSIYERAEESREIFIEKDPENKIFFDKSGKLDFLRICGTLYEYGEKLKKYICDHRPLVHKLISDRKKILLEGAQGLLLDIDHGTYPYVTSSNACAGGLSTGTGISPHLIERIFSVNGAYLTRVGNGPFPTELGRYDQIMHENGNNRLNDEEITACIQKKDDYYTGKAIRHIAGEFGTTTGRPRRVGWLDIPALKYCSFINGKDLILTKFDVLDTLPHISLVKNYRYIGQTPLIYNGQKITEGDIIDVFPTDTILYEKLEPAEKVTLEGWMTSTRECRYYDQLPENARLFLEKVEELSGMDIRILSVGPDREQTLCIK